MAWIKLDDHFDEHPKLAALSDSAFSLWVTSLAYANRNLTDGFIPNMVGLGKLRFCDGNTVPPIRELEAAGLWEKRDGGWQIHDYKDFQPSREKVLAERAAAQDRMKRVRSAEPRANINGSSSNPVPVPVPVSVSDSGPEPEKRKRAVARFAPPTAEEVADYCRDRNNGIDPQHFVDSYQKQGWKTSRGVPVTDWRACVRTWEARDRQGTAPGPRRNGKMTAAQVMAFADKEDGRGQR